MITSPSRPAGPSPSRWPVRPTSWKLWAVFAVLIVAAVLVGLPHNPSSAERAADLKVVAQDVKTDIESCAGGFGDSLTALRSIRTRSSTDVATAISIASLGSSNCNPLNNEQVNDLADYQVPESLSSYNIYTAVVDYYTWANPTAGQAQADIVNLLKATTPAARAAATNALNAELAKLDRIRTTAQGLMNAAERSLHADLSLPDLPR